MARGKGARGAGVVPTGIRGFDLLTQGGLPARKVTLLTGTAGAGKTVFAMQMAVTNAAAGRPGVYVTFEESPAELLANAAAFHWPSGRNVRRNLRVLGGDAGADVIVCGSFDLCGLVAMLEAELRQRRISWVVLDGLDQILSLLADPIAERREIYRLKRWAETAGVACLVTAKEDAGGWAREIGQADGLVAFAADCVVRLSLAVANGGMHRALRVAKYRGAAGACGERPMVINAGGILVGHVRDAPMAQASRERVGTGIAQLDEHLQGGYLRGSSVLISGQPGTSKTTLAACLAASACARRERVLMVLFDEGAAQARSHLRSVGIDLDTPARSGLLRMESLGTYSVSVEDHFVNIVAWMDEFAPAVLIIDPVSALAQAGGDPIGGSVAERLLHVARQQGITTLFTSLLGAGDPAAQASTHAAGISTLADTWIQLEYTVHSGERNRALSIVKSRGTRHSNQVRELVLEQSGPRLADVFIDGGTVLMGTARLEREQAIRQLEADQSRAFRDELEATRAQEQRLRDELATQRQRLTALRAQEASRENAELRRLEEIGASRSVAPGHVSRRIAQRRQSRNRSGPARHHREQQS